MEREFLFNLLFRLFGPLFTFLALFALIYFLLWLFGLSEPDHFDF